MFLKSELIRRMKAKVAKMHENRKAKEPQWQDLSDFYLPTRYVQFDADSGKTQRANARSPYILDPTGTMCAMVLAAGMATGITSPARPWLNLIDNRYTTQPIHPIKVWMEKCATVILRQMGLTNFYTSIDLAYLDMIIFGTAVMLIYEDDEAGFICRNSPVGEFCIEQDQRGFVSAFARKIEMTTEQMVDRFGIENVSQQIADEYKKSDASLFNSHRVLHLIEKNQTLQTLKYGLPKSMKYREIYVAESPGKDQEVLSVRGFRDNPVVAFRWETVANEVYSSMCPGITALPDVIQLQHETKAKGSILDLMHRPPYLVDVSLRNKPNAFIPGGKTYANMLQAPGEVVKPILNTTSAPYGEIGNDIISVQQRISKLFYNDLFEMISQLDTVRTATEIQGRQEEKMIRLGPVLFRTNSESLTTAVKRIFNILSRKGYFGPAPEGFDPAKVDIKYISILNDAQTAVHTAPIERFISMVGNLVQAYPEIKAIPNIDETVRGYATLLGVPETMLNSKEEANALLQQQQQAQQQQQTAEQVQSAANSAESLSNTDVGGGVNALEYLLGNGGNIQQ